MTESHVFVFVCLLFVLAGVLVIRRADRKRRTQWSGDGEGKLPDGIDLAAALSKHPKLSD